jgi:uncharacterized membrane protein YcaP (DUF421 family)
MEIILRASVTFFFIWILLRALGKRELAELTAVELVLIIVMGDLVQQGVTQEDSSVTGNLLAVGTLGFWILISSYASFRWKPIRGLVEGIPTIVVHDGRISEEVLKIERLDAEEVLSAAREQGITDVSDIRFGILEGDGKFSFIKTDRKAGQDEQPRGTQKRRSG